MQEEVWAVMCTEGQMKRQEMIECKEKRWAPLVVYRPKNEPDSPPRLITFDNDEAAIQFSKRNFPKDWPISRILLGDRDIAKIKGEMGFIIEKFTYPRRMYGHPQHDCWVEVYYFDYDPSLCYTDVQPRRMTWARKSS